MLLREWQSANSELKPGDCRSRLRLLRDDRRFSVMMSFMGACDEISQF